MERKNMVLLTVIAVATLLVAVVGATFAYFSSQVIEGRGEGSGAGKGTGETNLTTAKLADTITVANIDTTAGSFDAKEIFPGHMEIAGLSVEVKGNAGTYTVPFEYNVTENKIGANVKYYLYKDEASTVTGLTSEKLGCSLESDAGSENKVFYKESCTFKNAESISSSPSGEIGIETLSSLKLVASDNLTGTPAATNAQKVQIMDDITVESESKKVNYYFVIEYVNADDKEQGTQNTEMAQTLKGKITVLGATKKVGP